MLLHGDELGRTQQGNNNAYCQDNEVSWLDWGAVDDELLEFTAGLVALRRRHAAFRRRKFFKGESIRPSHRGDELPDIAWLDADGSEMTDDQWHEPHARFLAAFVNGEHIGLDRRGEPILDDSFLLLLNGHDQPVAFTVPPPLWGAAWLPLVDTAAGVVGDGRTGDAVVAGAPLEIPERSVVLLVRLPRHT
jgi:glycogen operon protein